MEYLSAFILGVIGSLHCVGMCGPLILIIPFREGQIVQYYSSRIAYFFGKSILYGVMGVILGTLGKGVSLMGIQQHISVVAGAAILLSLLIPQVKVLKSFDFLTRFYLKVSQHVAKYRSKNSHGSMFFLGMLNGILPCGLVYTALIGGLVLAEPFQSGMFMFSFGLGTIPALFVISAIRRLFTVRYQHLLKRSIPYLSAVVACLLILRGLNLGIPLVSPKASSTHQHTGERLDCCE